MHAKKITIYKLFKIKCSFSFSRLQILDLVAIIFDINESHEHNDELRG